MLETLAYLAAGVARGAIDVQLVLLVLVKEGAACFEDGQVVVVPVSEQVVVVALGDGLLELDHLAMQLGLAHCKGVGRPPVPHPLSQPSLETFLGRVQVVVHNLSNSH